MDPDQLDEAEAELADVEQALTRLDAGTYAACEVCGEPIGDDRLQTRPTVRTCVRHG